MDVTAAKPQSLRAVAQAIAPIGVALVAVAASITAVALAGESPVDALDALIEGSFGSRTAIAATLARMVPLTLVGLGWIVAFSTRRVSIGFEGQIVAGGIAATIVGLNFAGLPAAVHIAAATMAAALGGALWVAVPAAMWARRGVHEIISTLLMNTPAAIVGYFVYSLILPIAVGILSSLSSGFEKVAPWVEFNTAQTPLFTGDFTPTGEQWAQIATSGVIWLVIPLALGIARLLRIEFK